MVDQFEELFSLCHDVAERKDFVDNLLYAAQNPGPTVVVIVLRADFYDQCAPFENLRLVLCQQQQYIGAMCATELRQTIEEPARPERLDIRTRFGRSACSGGRQWTGYTAAPIPCVAGDMATPK